MTLGSGLNTSASVTINVGIRKNASFRQFDAALQDLRNSLREVSSRMGMDDSLRSAATAAQRTARGIDRINADNARKERARQRINAKAYLDDMKRASREESAANRTAAQNRARIMADAMAEVDRSRAARQQALDRARLRETAASAAAAARRLSETLNSPLSRLSGLMSSTTRTMLDMSKKGKRTWDEQFREATRSHNKFLRDKRAAENKALRDAERDAKASAARMAREAERQARSVQQARNLGLNATSQRSMQANLLGLISGISKTGKGSIFDSFGNETSFQIDRNRFAQRVQGLKSYIQQLKTGTATSAQFAQAHKLLSSAIDESIQHQKRMGSDMAYRLDQTEKQLDAIFRAGFRLQMVGMDLNQIFMRVRDTFRGIMNTFGEFQYTLFRAGATLDMFDSSVTDAEVNVSHLQEAALQLSRASMLLPAKDVAEAFYHWAAATGQVVRTTADLERNVDALRPIMQAALMTNTSYEQTIKGIYGVISQFFAGDITKATHVTEALFMQTQKTAAEFTDLINSFKMVGSVAAQNNTTFEDTVELFGRLADLGIRGTMAGRALRQMFIQNARPSGPAMGQWKELLDMLPELNKFTEVRQKYDAFMTSGGRPLSAPAKIDKIAQALLDAGYTDVQRNRFLATTTTANELPMLTALIMQAQRAIMGLDKETKQYRITSERAHQFFVDNWNALANTWNAVSGSVQRAWEHLQITIGSAMAEVLDPLMRKLSDIIEEIRIWAKANPQIIQSISKFAAGLGAVAAAGGAAFTALGTLVGLLAGIALVVKTISVKIPVISGFFTLAAAFAAGFVRNMDHITMRWNEFLDILRSAKVDFGAVDGIVKSVMQGIQNFADTILTTFADLLPHVGRFLKLLQDIGAMKFIIDAVAVAFLTIVSVKTIQGVIQLTKAIGAMTKSMIVLQGMSGPVGWLSLLAGFAFAAVSTNLLGIADGIDTLTGELARFNKESREAAKNFETLADRIESSAATLAVAVLPTIQEYLNAELGANLAASEITGSINPRGIIEDFILGALGMKDEQRAAVRATTEAEIRKRWEAEAAFYRTAILEASTNSMNKLNKHLVLKGKEPMSGSAFAQVMELFLPDPKKLTDAARRDPNTWGDITSRVITELARGGFNEANYSRIREIVAKTWGRGGQQDPILYGTVDGLLRYAASGAAIDHVIQSQRTKMQHLYQPLIDEITKTISSGIVDADTGQIDRATQMKVYELMFNPFRNLDSLADYVSFDKNASPEVAALFQNFLSIISQDIVEEAQTVGAKTAEEVWTAFVEATSDPGAIRKAIIAAGKKGSDVKQLQGFFNKLFNLDGKGSANFFRMFKNQRGNTGLQLAVDAMVGDITASVEAVMAENPGIKPARLLRMLEGSIPSAKEIGEKLGISRKKARAIRRALMRELKPLRDFLRNPLTPTTESGGEAGQKGKPWGGIMAGTGYKYELPKPSVDPVINAINTATTSVANFKSTATGAFNAIRVAMGNSAKAGAAKFDAQVQGLKGRTAAGAFSIGKSWGNSFNAGLTTSIIKGLSFVGTLTIGASPPPAGPLKDIDKGGFAVGRSWGENMGRGARESMRSQLMETRREMYRRNLSPEANVSYKASSERKVRVEVDIKSSDGTATRKTQEEIRRGAMEALSLSDVSHLVSVS